MNTLLGFLWEHLTIFLTFILGSLFTIGYATVQKKRKSKNLRKLYLDWYQLSKESIIHQLEHLKNYISAIQKDFPGTSKLHLSNIRIAELQALKNEEIFQAFVLDYMGNKQRHSKEMFQLTGHVQFLVTSLKEIKFKFENTQTSYKNWLLKWNDEIVMFHKLILEYNLKYQENMGSMVEEIVEIKSGFTGENAINHNTTDIIIKLVKPIEQIIQSHLVYDRNDKFLILITSTTQKLQILEEEKKHIKSTTIKILNHYLDSIDYTLKSADNNVSYFSKKRLFF